MCIYQLIELFKGLLTPLVAVIALYIAYQQWKTNQHKVLLDKYDRRFRIYEEVMIFLKTIRKNRHPSDEELIAFRQNTLEADFLFKPDIREYLDKLHEQGNKLRYLCEDEYKHMNQNTSNDYNHDETTQNMHDITKWLLNQFDDSKKKFREYLDLST